MPMFFSFRRLLPQRSDLSHVVLELSMSRRVALFQRLASAGIRQGEIRALFRSQKQGAVGHVVEKGTVVARRDHGAVAWQGGEKPLQDADPTDIHMVRRFVQQEKVGLDHGRSREKHGPLPASGQVVDHAVP